MICTFLANTNLLLPKLRLNHQPDFSVPFDIVTFDHKRMAMIKQTTKCDGKARFRSTLASVSAIACSIADDGIAVSKALITECYKAA